jgi:phosphate transport system protein
MPTSAEGFSQRTTALKNELVTQGGRVLGTLEMAFSSLFDRDVVRAQHAIASDDAIDQADVAIEQAAVALLMDATREGASLDSKQLREVLTIVKANNELERVADVAVDIAELVAVLARMGTPFPDTFRVLTNSCVGILRDTNASLARSDAQLGNIVLQSQHAVWAFKSALVREAEQNLAKGVINPELAFHLVELAGMCEVIADHCTNIAEQVIYQTTGAIVRHMESAWVQVGQPKN